MAPRISLHAFFFLLCRWKAEGCRMTDGVPRQTLHGHILNLSEPRCRCILMSTPPGWLPGYSAFSRRSTSARRLLRSGVEVAISPMDSEIFRWLQKPCQYQVVPLPPKPQFGHSAPQSTSCGCEAQGSTSTSTADVVSSASVAVAPTCHWKSWDEIGMPGIVTPRAAWASFSSVSIMNTSSQARWHIVQIHFIMPSCRVGDGTDADEEAHHISSSLQQDQHEDFSLDQWWPVAGWWGSAFAVPS